MKAASPEVRTLGDQLREASPDEVKEMKQQLKDQGFGDIEGNTGEEVFDNALKKTIQRELERRQAAKAAKVAAPKAPDKPLPNKPESRHERIDSRALAEGLDLTDPHDAKMLDQIQRMLDGEDTTLGKNPTPARIGRYLEQWNGGPAGPRGSSGIGRAIHEQGPPSPERDARLAQLEKDRARGDEWQKLADRLMKTRRQPKRDHTPTPEPKVTSAEKADLAKAAEHTGIPQADLEKAALKQKVAQAPPKQSAQQVADTLKTVSTPEEGDKLLSGRTRADLQEIAKATGVETNSRMTKPQLIDAIRRRTVDGRLNHDAHVRGAGGAPSVSTPGRRAELEAMNIPELKALEDELGIKRTSMNREDRIAAVLAHEEATKGGGGTGGAPAARFP